METFHIILWVAIGSALLGVLVLAFSWVLVAREVPWWEQRMSRYEAWFASRAPSSGTLIHNGVLLAAAWVVFAMVLAVFYGLAQLFPGAGGLVAIDQSIYTVVDGDASGWLVTILTGVTHAADVLTVCLLSAVAAVVLLWRGHGWTTCALGVTVIGGMGMTWLMKMLTDRSRPEGGLIGTAGESFPSGHGALSVLMYGFLIYLVWRFMQIRWAQITLTAVLVLLIIFIGISRVVLSVHWTSDVIAGYVLGLSWMMYSLATVRVLREASQVAVEK